MNAELHARLVRAAREESPSRKARERAFAAASVVALGLDACGGARLHASSRFWAWIVWAIAGMVGLAVIATADRYQVPPLDHDPTVPAEIAFDVPAMPVRLDGDRSVTLPRVIAPPPLVVSTPIAIRADAEEPELVLLRRAKRAIATGEPAAALAILDRRARAYPHGMLAEEAEVLAVEALVGTGDRTRARAAANRFTSAHPASPYAERVGAIVPRLVDPGTTGP